MDPARLEARKRLLSALAEHHVAPVVRGPRPESIVPMSTRQPSDSSPIVLGFYVNWDDNSFFALQAHARDMDWVVGEWAFLNDSGTSVQAAAAFFKLPPGTITAFHDELDLAPGKVRVKRGGGAAGHNGLRSMDRHLGTPEYWRVRLGIGHPGDKARVYGHVLGDFAKVDRDWLIALLDGVAEAAPLLAGGKPEDFMTRVALVSDRKGS